MNTLRFALFSTFLASSCALVACGDDTSGTGGSSSSSTTSSGTGGATSSSTSTTSSGTGGAGGDGGATSSSTGGAGGTGGDGGMGGGGMGGDGGGGMGQGGGGMGQGGGGMGQGGGGMGQGGGGMGGDGGGGGGGGMPAPTFRVVRVGDGSATLSAASTAAFLEERELDGTLVGTPIALPTSATATNHPLTLAGTATYDGGLTRSANGAYLVLAGYAVAPGTGSVAGTASNTVQRVVGRIDASGNVDTSTLLGDGLGGVNVRGAASIDGTSFWAYGAGSAMNSIPGVVYALLGGTTSTPILDTPSINTRAGHIFAGQLYGSSSANSVFSIGTALPTAAGQAGTSLPGLPVSGASSGGFALLDRDASVVGVDTLYVADDRAQNNGGGVQKYTLTGGTWTLAATLTSGFTTGARQLTAFEHAGQVKIVVSTSANPPQLIVLTDDGTATGSGVSVATSPTNTAFRGVALSPM